MFVRSMSERTKYIVNELASGRTQVELSKELGISRERVRQLVWEEYRRQTESKYALLRRNEYGVSLMKILRVSRGLTIGNVAKSMGRTPATIRGWEKAKCLKLYKAREIAKFYGVRLGELFMLDDEKKREGGK